MGSLSENVARNVRRRRSKLGLSQDALADLAGLHRTYIGAVEREEKNLTLKSLQKLGAALQIEPWKLVTPDCGAAYD